jgi:predicted amidohydrolase YtcJ
VKQDLRRIDAKMQNSLAVKGRIWTGEETSPFAEAFLVENGFIAAVGNVQEIRARAPGKTDWVDAGRNLVTPGLSDCHIHLTAQARQDLYVDLGRVRSLDEALEELRSRAKKLPKGSWVRGVNYNEEAWKEVLKPTRELLDATGLENPLVISRYCGHVHVANTEALARGGLWDSADPNVVRGADGTPTGVLNEGAAGPLISSIADECEKPGTITALLEETCKRLASLGITTAHACDAPSYALGEDIRAFQELEEQGRLPLRILCYHDALPNFSFRSGFGSERVRYAGFKVFCDGSIGGHTAAMSAPYADNPATSGQLNHDDEELYALLAAARKRDIQVQIHVIGDLAIDQAVRTVERIERELGLPKLPYRFNHCTYCPQDLVKRMKRLGVAVDAQPVQPFRNRRMAPARLGTGRLPFSYAYRRFFDEGLVVTGSSDGPIEDLNPWAGIWAAVNRTDGSGAPMRYSPPDDRLSLDEALRMYTVNPWIAVGRGNELGKILPGYGADFTVLDCDPFEYPSDELKNVRHRCTFVGGVPAWGGI